MLWILFWLAGFYSVNLRISRFWLFPSGFPYTSISELSDKLNREISVCQFHRKLCNSLKAFQQCREFNNAFSCLITWHTVTKMNIMQMTLHLGCLLWRLTDIFGAKLGEESALAEFDWDWFVQLFFFFNTTLFLCSDFCSSWCQVWCKMLSFNKS